MSGASSWDGVRKMDSILKAMSSASSCDDSRKMDSILKATSSISGGDDGCKMSKGKGSSSVEEADQGGNRKMRKRRRSSSVEGADKGGEIPLKKGPWTREEDATLKEFVKNHEEGDWNAVQKYSGLARCGKSCRFRWVNYLKPNLKKGAFTAEEEQRIVELHASMGNKWSKIAAELPGRTDNEIKNFWHTRVKRRQRAGQTTYPKEVEIHRQQVQNGNQEILNPDAALTNEAGQHDSISQNESYGIRDVVEFGRLKLRQCISDILSQQYNLFPMMHPSVSDMLADLDQSTHSSLYNMLPMMHPSKRLRGSDMIYNSFDPYAVPTFDMYDTSDPRLFSRFDPIFNTSDQFGNFLTGSHAGLNGTISASSDPIYGAFKVDLPSVQNHKPESSLPPLESVDTPESSIEFQPSQSVPVTHQNNDGLLESIFYGSKNSNGSNNVDSSQQNNDHFVPYEATQNSILNSNGSNDVDSFQQNNAHHSNGSNDVDSFQQNSTLNSMLNPSETQWDDQEALRSPLGQHAASVQGFHKVEHPSFQYFEAQKRIWHTKESSLPPFVESVNRPECSIQLQPNQSVPVSHQNNGGLLESILYSSKNFYGSNNVDSFQENNVDSLQQNNDHCVLNEEVQNSTLNPYETQWVEPEALRSSLGPFTSSVVAEDTYITNSVCSVETIEDHGDKHGALTEFPTDSPSPENENPIETLCDPDSAPDLSFMENDSPSPENQYPIEILLDPGAASDLSFIENDSPSPENQNPLEFLSDLDPAPDRSFMENDSPSPENQNPIQFLLNPYPAPGLSFMENDSPSPENQNRLEFFKDPNPSPDLSYMENRYFNGES